MRRGRGAKGRRFSTSSPRDGRRPPRSDRATTSTTNVSRACTPGIGLPLSVGNHDSVATHVISDWPMPMANPATAAIHSELNPANRAAARAGTMNNTRVTESAWESGAATTPIAPAIADASTVLAIESWFGDSPLSIAVTSFSDAARVASPNRVQRNRAPSASVISTTMPAIQNRLTGIELPRTSTMRTGNTLGICRGASPNHRSIVACSTRRMPSDATSLARGDDVRSGRNTSSSPSTPTSTAAAIVMASAATVANCGPK